MPPARDRCPPRRLLSLVLDAGKADRFAPADFVRDAKWLSLVSAVEHLVEVGLVERVVEKCGVWHYRLTDVKLCEAISAGGQRMPARTKHYQERPRPSGASITPAPYSSRLRRRGQRHQGD